MYACTYICVELCMYLCAYVCMKSEIYLNYIPNIKGI